MPNRKTIRNDILEKQEGWEDLLTPSSSACVNPAGGGPSGHLPAGGGGHKVAPCYLSPHKSLIRAGPVLGATRAGPGGGRLNTPLLTRLRSHVARHGRWRSKVRQNHYESTSAIFGVRSKVRSSEVNKVKMLPILPDFDNFSIQTL